MTSSLPIQRYRVTVRRHHILNSHCHRKTLLLYRCGKRAPPLHALSSFKSGVLRPCLVSCSPTKDIYHIRHPTPLLHCIIIKISCEILTTIANTCVVVLSSSWSQHTMSPSESLHSLLIEENLSDPELWTFLRVLYKGLIIAVPLRFVADVAFRLVTARRYCTFIHAVVVVILGGFALVIR